MNMTSLHGIANGDEDLAIAPLQLLVRATTTQILDVRRMMDIPTVVAPQLMDAALLPMVAPRPMAIPATRILSGRDNARTPPTPAGDMVEIVLALKLLRDPKVEHGSIVMMKDTGPMHNFLKAYHLRLGVNVTAPTRIDGDLAMSVQLQPCLAAVPAATVAQDHHLRRTSMDTRHLPL